MSKQKEEVKEIVEQKKPVARDRVLDRDAQILKRVEVRKQHPERETLAYKGRLQFNVDLDRKNFHYYVECDRDHEINMLIELGYEPVLTDTGRVVRVNLNKHSEQDGILMRIPLDKFNKLQAARERDNKEQEASIYKGKIRGDSSSEIGTETFESYTDIKKMENKGN